MTGKGQGVVFNGDVAKGSFCEIYSEKNNTPLAFIKILMYIVGVLKFEVEMDILFEDKDLKRCATDRGFALKTLGQRRAVWLKLAMRIILNPYGDCLVIITIWLGIVLVSGPAIWISRTG